MSIGIAEENRQVEHNKECDDKKMLPDLSSRVIKYDVNALLYPDEICLYRTSFWYRGAVFAVYQEKVVA